MESEISPSKKLKMDKNEGSNKTFSLNFECNYRTFIDLEENESHTLLFELVKKFNLLLKILNKKNILILG